MKLIDKQWCKNPHNHFEAAILIMECRTIIAPIHMSSYTFSYNRINTTVNNTIRLRNVIKPETRLEYVHLSKKRSVSYMVKSNVRTRVRVV